MEALGGLLFRGDKTSQKGWKSNGNLSFSCNADFQRERTDSSFSSCLPGRRKATRQLLWSGLAQFLGDMIVKYTENIDFEFLSDPDKYLLQRFMRKFYKHVVRASMKRNKSRIYVEIVVAL